MDIESSLCNAPKIPFRIPIRKPSKLNLNKYSLFNSIEGENVMNNNLYQENSISTDVSENDVNKNYESDSSFEEEIECDLISILQILKE